MTLVALNQPERVRDGSTISCSLPPSATGHPSPRQPTRATTISGKSDLAVTGVRFVKIGVPMNRFSVRGELVESTTEPPSLSFETTFSQTTVEFWRGVRPEVGKEKSNSAAPVCLSRQPVVSL